LGTVCGAGVKTGMYLFGSKGAEAKWSEYLGTSVALDARVNLRCGVSLEGGRIVVCRDTICEFDIYQLGEMKERDTVCNIILAKMSHKAIALTSTLRPLGVV